MAESTSTHQQVKEEGNAFFRDKNYTSALSSYKRALNMIDRYSSEAAVLYSNMAACHLALQQYEECAKACDGALEISPTNPKALYRRSMAFEQLKKYEESIKDLRELLRLEPNNKDAKAALPRLVKALQDTMSGSSIQGVTKRIVDPTNAEDQEKAASLLLMLIKESDQAIEFLKTKGLDAIKGLLKSDTLSNTVRSSLNNVLGVLSNQPSTSIELITSFSLQYFFDLILNENDAETKKVGITILSRAATAFQAKLEELKQSQFKKTNEHPPRVIKDESPELKAAIEDLEKQVQTLRVAIVVTLSKYICDEGTPMEVVRQALLGLAKFPWQAYDVEQFINQGYIYKFMKLAADRFENDFSLLSIVLARVYDVANQHKDLKPLPVPKSAEYVRDFLKGEDLKHHINAMVALLCIIMADTAVGVGVLLQDMLSVLTNLTTFPKDSNPLDQRFLLLLTTEVFAYAADHEDFQKIHSLPMEELEELFRLINTPDKSIQARVVSTLAKLGLASPEVRAYLMKDKGEKAMKITLNLLEGDSSKTDFNREFGEARSVKQWAVETLSFLTRIPDLKEKLINEYENYLPLLLSFTGSPSATTAPTSRKSHFADFAVVSILHNLTFNPKMGMSKTDEELQAELDKLKKFAGEKGRGKIHPLDSPEHVEKRCVKVVEHGATAALVHVAKDISRLTEGMCDVLAHVFLNLADYVPNRGRIIKDGGIKVLVSLTEHASPKGQTAAAHAIAKIAITTNPHIAFKNGIEFAFIKPLMQLTKSETPLQQFEALLALTNLAEMNEETRAAICKDNGLEWIEGLQLEEDVQLRRAACELLCNLLYCPYVWEDVYHSDRAERRLKMWGIFVQSDDVKTQSACAGALATLSRDPEIAKKFEAVIDMRAFVDLIASDNVDLEHRGVVIVKNLLKHAQKSVRDSLVEFGCVPHLEKLTKSKHPAVAKGATKSLQLIKATTTTK